MSHVFRFRRLAWIALLIVLTACAPASGSPNTPTPSVTAPPPPASPTLPPSPTATITATPAPSDTPTPTPVPEKTTSACVQNICYYDVSYPGDWKLSSNQMLVTLSPRSTSEWIGAIKSASFATAPLADMTSLSGSPPQPKDLADMWARQFFQKRTSEGEFDANGNRAYELWGTSSNNIPGYIAVIIQKDLPFAAVMIADVQPNKLDEAIPVLQTLARSITFHDAPVNPGQKAAGQLDPSVTALKLPAGPADLETDPFVSRDGGYSLRYPAGWKHWEGKGRANIYPDVAHGFCALHKQAPPAACKSPVSVMIATEFRWPKQVAARHPRLLDLDGPDGPNTAALLFQFLYKELAGDEFIQSQFSRVNLNGVQAGGAYLRGSTALSTPAGKQISNPYRGYMIMVKNSDQWAVLYFQTPEGIWEQMRPVFAAMLESFSFTGN